VQDPTQAPDFAQRLIDTAQAIILVLDTEGRIVHINPYMEAVSGYKLQEVQGEDWFGTFLPAAQQTHIKELFLSAIDDIKTKGNVNPIVTKDGTERYIQWYDTTLKDDQGVVIGLLSTGQDVTERLMIERNLGIKNAAVDSTNNAIAFADMEGNLTYVNRAFLDLWGYESAGPLYGTHATNYWYEAGEAAQVIVAISESGHWKGELVAVRKDGTTFPANVSASMVTGKHGQPLGLMSIFEDITERKQAERALVEANKALKNSEEQYRALFNTALDAILIADDEARYVNVNPAACELLGYTADELLKLSVPEVTSYGDQANFKPLWQSFLKQGVQRGEYTVRRKDGVEVEVDYRAVANYMPGRHLAVMHDISERKRAEQSLIEAKEQAEQASEAKSLFLSRMSHELRTPLNSILGFAQLLDADLDQDHKEKLKYIISSGSHLLDLINDLLDLSKIESDKLEISTERVALDRQIQDCIEAIQPLAGAQNIEIRCDLQQFHNQFVRADPIRLKQVLLNLLSNAVKYNRPQGCITLSGESNSAGRFRVSVSDTGRGIPKEHFPSLFEPFSRLYLDTYAVEGSGIGLALAKQLMELMDGSIGVESELEKGSTFWVEFTKSTPVEVEQSDKSTEDQGPNTTQANGFKLLYIEDSPAHIKLVEAIFAREDNIQLYTANTPRLGLELVRSYNPDLILLDICLPEMDGYQVFNRLCEDASTSHIPVIALSASAMPHEIEKGLRSGFRRYLTKPVDIGELLRAVKEVLQDNAAIHPSQSKEGISRASD